MCLRARLGVLVLSPTITGHAFAPADRSGWLVGSYRGLGRGARWWTGSWKVAGRTPTIDLDAPAREGPPAPVHKNRPGHARLFRIQMDGPLRPHGSSFGGQLPHRSITLLRLPANAPRLSQTAAASPRIG